MLSQERLNDLYNDGGARGQEDNEELMVFGVQRNAARFCAVAIMRGARNLRYENRGHIHNIYYFKP